MASRSPWSHLPEGILDFIFDCTKDPIDILRCGAVCKSWRPTALQVYRKYFPLCFIQPNKYKDDDNIVLFNILNKETRKIQLSETKGKSVLCGYNDWLLTLDPSDSSPRMHLLNIFSKTQILLPPISSLPIDYRSVYLNWKLYLTKYRTSSDFGVVLLCDRVLSGCKSSGENWLSCTFPRAISDVILHNGSLYFSRNSPPALYSQQLYGAIPAELILTDKMDATFLVKSLDDDLWLVFYRREHPDGNFFYVFEFEKLVKEYRKLKDLEGCTLFISPNGYHLAKTGNFKANCIYYIRQSEGDYLIYDMETGQSELVAFPDLVEDGKSLISWVIPHV